MNDVDLQQLAIDREEPTPSAIPRRRHLLTRYVIPFSVVWGFVVLVVWMCWDLAFPPREVTVVRVLESSVHRETAGTELFQASGWIEPRPTPVRVAALAPGVVEELLVVEDQRVEAGEPIARLVKDDARLSRRRAVADLALRQAELQKTNATHTAATTRLEQPVHLEALVGAAAAAVAKLETMLKNLPFETRRAKAELAFVQKDYEGKVAARGVVADVEIDKARSQLASARALVEELSDRDSSLSRELEALTIERDALNTQLKLLVDETKARDEALALVEVAKARVAQAEVVLAEATLRLDRMTVVAPVAGRVFHLIGHPGSRIGSGMMQMLGHDGSTVVTLYQPKKLQARVDVRFEDLPKVVVGQPVQIRNVSSSETLKGRVLFFNSRADIQKNTLEVKVLIENAPPVFKPEMLVEATFLAPSSHSAKEQAISTTSQERYYVPRSLVRQDTQGKFVWIVDQSLGIARRTAVETGGQKPGGLVEIIGKLTVSSRVIATGTDGLADGERVRVIAEEPEAAFSHDAATSVRKHEVVD